MDCRVSIALTTYNGEKYIEDQLNSLIRQTRKFDELIICDDNSTDSTYNILEKYASENPNIKLFRNKIKLGFKKNFEQAILYTTGDYIALCDQDDIWCDNHLQVLLNSIGDNMLVAGDAIIESNDNRSGMNLSYLMHLSNLNKQNKDLLKFAFLYHNPFLGMTMMMNKEFIKEAIPIPEHVNYHDSWFAFLAIAKNSFIYVPKVITKYRLHGGNVTGNYKRHLYIRTIVAHFLFGHRQNDRLYAIDEISNRIEFDHIMKKEINILNDYFINENSFKGRLKNLFFELKNYNRIYR